MPILPRPRYPHFRSRNGGIRVEVTVRVDEAPGGKGDRGWLALQIQAEQVVIVAVVKVGQRKRRHRGAGDDDGIARPLCLPGLAAPWDGDAAGPDSPHRPLRACGATAAAAPGPACHSRLPLRLGRHLRTHQARPRRERSHHVQLV